MVRRRAEFSIGIDMCVSEKTSLLGKRTAHRKASRAGFTDSERDRAPVGVNPGLETEMNIWAEGGTVRGRLFREEEKFTRIELGGRVRNGVEIVNSFRVDNNIEPDGAQTARSLSTVEEGAV